eukprot:Rmarinus@m.20370
MIDPLSESRVMMLIITMKNFSGRYIIETALFLGGGSDREAPGAEDVVEVEVLTLEDLEALMVDDREVLGGAPVLLVGGDALVLLPLTIVENEGEKMTQVLPPKPLLLKVYRAQSQNKRLLKPLWRAEFPTRLFA